MNEASFEEISRLIGYEADTGRFVWLESRGTVSAGQEAGRWNERGYRTIAIDGREYRAHRIAWLLTHGKWPVETIDHISGDQRDNRLCNLREASLKQNLLNRGRRQSAAGLKGVHKRSTGRFRAVIRRDGKQHSLGEFDTAEAAHLAYVDAAKKLHGEFARFS